MSTLSTEDIKEIMRREGISQPDQDKYLAGIEAPLFPDEERVEVFMLVIHNDRIEALRAIEGLFLSSYPFRITIFENSKNSRNTAQIWNKLIRESHSEFIMFIDSDCFPENDIISEMVEVLKTHPDAIAVGPDGSGSIPDHHHVKEVMVTKNHISGCCFMLRKSLWEKLPFDEDFVFYGQDSDWGERILESEYNAYITPKARVWHGDSVSATKLAAAGSFNPQMDSYIARKIYERKMAQREALRLNYNTP